MDYISSVFKALLNLVFPQTKRDKELEKFSSEDLSERLKPHTLEYDENMVALFVYRDPLIRNVIGALKYDGKVNIAEKFSQILYPYLVDLVHDVHTFTSQEQLVLIPVPLSKKRMKDRGYNQVELIINEVLKQDINNLFEKNFSVVKKLHHTPSQVSIKDRGARIKNVRGTFGISDPSSVHNKIIVLIDDVITTGSTVCEIRNLLVKAGAKEVYVVALAH